MVSDSITVVPSCQGTSPKEIPSEGNSCPTEKCRTRSFSVVIALARSIAGLPGRSNRGPSREEIGCIPNFLHHDSAHSVRENGRLFCSTAFNEFREQNGLSRVRPDLDQISAMMELTPIRLRPLTSEIGRFFAHCSEWNSHRFDLQIAKAERPCRVVRPYLSVW